MTATNLSAAAFDLAAHGWTVFPCKWRGKNAKAPLTTNGHLDASRDLDQITAWWTRWPSAMIGAPVPESLVVVDIDPRNGGSLAELESLTGVRLSAKRNKVLFWSACRAPEKGIIDALAVDLMKAPVSVGLSDIKARRAVASARKTVAP